LLTHRQTDKQSLAKT